jgi:RHS repeat-associated protein
VHADVLNTPRAITDGKGSTIWTWAISGNPFGEQMPSSSVGYAYNLRFPGQYYDSETELNYNIYRYNDSATGRYIQADPAGFSGGQSSLYSYVDGKPLSNVDPLGLWQVTANVTVSPIGIGPGGTLTFGYNHGQFNVGGWLGGSLGDSLSIDPSNAMCHESGSFRSVRADGRLGVEGGLLSVDFSAQYGPQQNSVEFTSGVPFAKSLSVGGSIQNGELSTTPIVNFVAGGSVFLGYGAQWYF